MPDVVFWDHYRKRHMIRLELDPDEAENIAFALGMKDSAVHHLIRMADDARVRDKEHARRRYVTRWDGVDA